MHHERRGVRIRAEHYEKRNEQMDELQRKIWALLCRESGEKVASLLTDYHGLQLLDEGFAQHLIDEGVCEASELGMSED